MNSRRNRPIKSCEKCGRDCYTAKVPIICSKCRRKGRMNKSNVAFDRSHEGRLPRSPELEFEHQERIHNFCLRHDLGLELFRDELAPAPEPGEESNLDEEE